jgi:alcohol dehydrogenase class IV
MVLALGGGSVIDTATAAAFLARNDGEISDYIMGRKTGTEALPIVAVPTTAGTGSEANRYAVLTDPDTKNKKALRNPAFIRRLPFSTPSCSRRSQPVDRLHGL